MFLHLLRNFYVSSATLENVLEAPKCHPGTRTSVLAALSSWVEDTASSVGLVWLHGPAGTGKSAIVRSLAESLHHNGLLAASFFFSRTDSSRNTKTTLVTTLAYQIASNLPETQTYIANAIAADPSILCQSLQTQFNSLIFKPLKFVADSRSRSLLRPTLILIDALDECDTTEARQQILDMLFTALQPLHGLIKFLVVSRPEYDIQLSFDSAVANLGRHINTIDLEGDRQAHDDIRLYLDDAFRWIKQSHPLRKHFSPNWPSEDAIEQLVGKSSGHFIYANTVVNYIEDAQSQPQERLDIILNLRTISDVPNPYAALDIIYLNVLKSSKTPHPLLVNILSLIMVTGQFDHPSLDASIIKSTRFMESILFIQPGEVERALLDLKSLVGLEGIVQFWHASFSDFLLDSSRSKEFSAYPTHACTLITKGCLRLLSDKTGLLERLWLDCNFKNPSLQYHHVLSLCCKNAVVDRDLRTAFMKYEFNVIPDGPSTSTQYFSVFCSCLNNYQQTSVFKKKVINYLRHQFDKYLISELRRWVPPDPEIMDGLRAVILPVHVNWKAYKGLAGKNPVLLNHDSCFLHYMNYGGSDDGEGILCEFFYSKDRAGEYYLGEYDAARTRASGNTFRWPSFLFFRSPKYRLKTAPKQLKKPPRHGCWLKGVTSSKMS